MNQFDFNLSFEPNISAFIEVKFCPIHGDSNTKLNSVYTDTVIHALSLQYCVAFQ